MMWLQSQSVVCHVTECIIVYGMWYMLKEGHVKGWHRVFLYCCYLSVINEIGQHHGLRILIFFVCEDKVSDLLFFIFNTKCFVTDVRQFVVVHPFDTCALNCK